jgi:hypothetical protein
VNKAYGRLGSGLFLDQHRQTVRDSVPWWKTELLPGETARQRPQVSRLGGGGERQRIILIKIGVTGGHYAWQVVFQLATAALCPHAVAKTVLNRDRGQKPPPRRQKSGLGAKKSLEGTGKEDTIMVEKMEWPALVAGRRAYGKYRIESSRQVVVRKSAEGWSAS